jgi:multiple sugar transport system permease protein
MAGPALKYQFLKISGRTLVYIVIAVGILITIFPILWMISTSFKPVDALFNMPPEWIPKNPTVQSFRNLFKEGSFFVTYFLNSFVVCLSTTAITVFVASLAGYAFSRFTFRGSRFVMFVILVSQMFPIVMLLISIFNLFLKLKLVNTYPALMLTYTGFALPFSIWMLKNYFDTLPREIEEAAYIDGCDRFRVLTKIVYPVTGPAILSVALFVFLVGWNELMYALTLTNTDHMRTIPPGLVVTYQGQYQVYWSEMMAASLLVSVPIILLFIFMQRHFIQGMTMGAVKE